MQDRVEIEKPSVDDVRILVFFDGAVASAGCNVKPLTVSGQNTGSSPTCIRLPRTIHDGF